MKINKFIQKVVVNKPTHQSAVSMCQLMSKIQNKYFKYETGLIIGA